MNPLSNVQLRDYTLEYLLIESNPEYKPDNTERDAEFGFEFNLGKDPTKPIYLVTIEVAMNISEQVFRIQPYRIKIKLNAVLEFDKSLPEAEIMQLLGPNGLAMTYSIARGIVGQATGTAVHGKFVLPTINFMKILEEKVKDEKAKQEPKKPVKKKKK